MTGEARTAGFLPDRRNDFCVLMMERLNPRGGELTPHYPSKINNPVYTADLTTSGLIWLGI